MLVAVVLTAAIAMFVAGVLPEAASVPISLVVKSLTGEYKKTTPVGVVLFL